MKMPLLAMFQLVRQNVARRDAFPGRKVDVALAFTPAGKPVDPERKLGKFCPFFSINHVYGGCLWLYFVGFSVVIGRCESFRRTAPRDDYGSNDGSSKEFSVSHRCPFLIATALA